MIPAFALILLLPPFLNLFRVDRLLFGIPLEAVCLFTIWTALVVGAALLSRHMPRQSDIDPEPAPTNFDQADQP